MNLYGYLFGGLEYLFLCRILVLNGCLVLLWFSMKLILVGLDLLLAHVS